MSNPNSSSETDDSGTNSGDVFGVQDQLIEVFSVIPVNKEIRDHHPSGFIQVSNRYGIQYIARSDSDKDKDVLAPLIHIKKELVVTVRGPIHALDDTLCTCHLFGKDYQYTCSENLIAAGPDEVVVTEALLKSKENAGLISVTYGVFRRATAAKISVRIFEFDYIESRFRPHCPASVFGVITACNSKLDSEKCTSILFARKSDNRFDVDDEGSIHLTKSGVGVPLSSELIIDFYLFYGGQSYNGEVRFCAATVGEVTEYVRVAPDNMVMFTVNWGVDPDSLLSFYDVKSDNNSSSSSSSCSTSSAEEYDFLDTKEPGLSSVEPCGVVTSGKMKVKGLSPRVQPPKPAVTQTDELCSMAKVRLQFGRFGNHHTFEVDERVALFLHYRKYKDLGDCYALPHMTREMATRIIEYCQAAVAGKSILTNDNPDDLTIFNLILASHSLKVRCLLKQTCDTFIARAEIKVNDVVILGNEDDEKELGILDVYRGLRWGERGRLTLISKCVVPERFIYNQEMPFIKRRVDSFIDDVCKFMTIENIDQKAQCIQVLETSTRREPRLAERVEAADPTTFMAFISGLIIHDLRDPHFDIKIGAMSILSRMAVDKSCVMIRDEAVPHIVELLSHEHVPLQMAAVMALTCLLSSSSANVSMVSKMDALRAAPAIIRCPGHGVEIIDNMRKMIEALAEVDMIYSKGNQLVLLEVVRSFFRKDLGYYNLHRVSACRVLCYQSYRRSFLIDRDVCSLLIDFIRNENSPTELVGAALEVVGNIVMWGNRKRIENLTKDCGLLRCLETHVLLCDKDIFRKEACTIISNIALHSRKYSGRMKLLKEMHEVSLMEKLYELLKNGAPDVKMEAARACGNAIFGFAPHLTM